MSRSSPARRPTLKSVAALAGVSLSTASLVFSGKGPVAEATRERVLTAAQKLHYLGPDPLASSLRRGRAGVVAVIVEGRLLHAFHDPYAVSILDGLSAVLDDIPTGMLLLSQSPQEPEHAIERLAGTALDATVFLGCGARSNPLTEHLRSRGIPMVAFGAPLDPDIVQVDIDGRAATRELARHLAGLGHTRVAHVALPTDARATPDPDPQAPDRVAPGHVTPERPTSERPTSDRPTSDHIAPDSIAPDRVTPRRIAPGRIAPGQVVALRDLDRVPFPDVAHRIEGVADIFGAATPVVIASSSDVEGGHDAGLALLAGPPALRPTAILAQSDLLAVGVVRAAGELGLRVPGDLSVTGFDGVALDWWEGTMTTAVQPGVDKGAAAGRMVRELLDGRRPDDVLLDTHLRIGTTTGPPPHA